MKSVLLISTYNWPKSLDLVFQSLLLQTVFPDEIIIADDGSNEETKQLIKDFEYKSNFSISHIWQEDKGFRKAKILNKAISQSNAEYIIQIDGDCIMHKEFIKDHLNAAQKGVYLYGSRVNILPDFVSKVLENKKVTFGLFSKEIKNKTRNIYIPFLSERYKVHDGISKKFRGCNVSYWRNDFIAINGYNEDFEGWGREDSDLAIRLGNYGIKSKRLRYCGILYHIHHTVNSKQNLELNDKIEKETLERKVIRISKGVHQYLK